MAKYDALTMPPPLPKKPQGWLEGYTRRQFIAMGLVWLAPLPAFLVGAPWFVGVGLLVTAILTTTAIVQKHGGLELLGPHFFFDLLRLSRRVRNWEIRALYTIFLLIGLGFVYWIQFRGQGLLDIFSTNQRHMTKTDMGQFAEKFVFAVIFIQNLTVFLLTPVYLGSAVAEERERGTLQLLFTTHLRDREIVLGKLMSRMVHLGAILLAGLPILSLAQLWGGVDMGILALNFVNTLMNLLSVGSLSILISVLNKRVVYAVLWVYGIVFFFGMCFVPVALSGNTSVFGLMQGDFASRGGSIYASIIAMVFFHSLITTTCVSVAMVVLRGQRAAELDRPLRAPRRPPRNRRPPVQTRANLDAEPTASLKVNRTYYLPRVNNDPLFWKEYQVGGPPVWYSPVVYLTLIIPIVSIAMVFLATLAEHGVNWLERHHRLGYVVKFFIVALAGMYCLAVAFKGCGAIVRERQQKTLDSLLTIPESRERLLLAKWLGNFFYPSGFALGLLGTIVIGAATLGIHYAGAMILIAAIVVHAAFLSSFAISLSVLSRTILAAYARLALLVLVMIGGTALWTITLNLPAQHWSTNIIEIGLNPIRTWLTLAFSYQDMDVGNVAFLNHFGASLAGVGFYALLAIIFWWLACKSFSRERYRHME